MCAPPLPYPYPAEGDEAGVAAVVARQVEAREVRKAGALRVVAPTIVTATVVVVVAPPTLLCHLCAVVVPDVTGARSYPEVRRHPQNNNTPQEIISWTTVGGCFFFLIC